MLSMNNKVKFSFLGMDFDVRGYTTSYDGVHEIVVGCVGGGQMVKQYIKQKYPNHSFKVWVKSEKYSGGSSLRINLSERDGSKVSNEIYEDIETFGNTLQLGNFNGMIDMYEYREDSPTTDNGTPMKYFPSYVFVNNKPKWGSVEYWMNEWYELKDNYKDVSEFLSSNKTYMTDKEFANVKQNLTIS